MSLKILGPQSQIPDKPNGCTCKLSGIQGAPHRMALRRLHPGYNVGQLPPEMIECLPDLIGAETELLPTIIASEPPGAANPVKLRALKATVRAPNDLHNAASDAQGNSRYDCGNHLTPCSRTG